MNITQFPRLQRWLAPCGLLLLASSAALATNALTTVPQAPTAPSSRVRVYPNIPTQPLSVVADLATHVVHGRVMGARQVMGSDVTEHMELDFLVDASLKGQAPEMLSVWISGGPNLVVTGSPRLQVGQEAILFTHPMEGGHSGLLGLSQGVYKVDRSSDGAHRVSGTHAPAGTLLADFVQRVEAGVSKSQSKEVR